MLTELHIEHLGVIEALDLILGPGLTAVTGETGAGKTMLVEAISLLVGGRADASLIRPGFDEARVEGRFVVKGASGDDEEYVVARVIPADGRSRAYVNGRLATAATLAEIGQRTVDLHGQHAHQSLLSAAVQRVALDRFGNVDLSPLQAARAALTEVDALLATLGGDARARAREIDLLRFQVGEIDTAAIESAEEDDHLGRREELLADAVAHREAGGWALNALTDEAGAADAIGTALAAVSNRSPFDALVTRLRSLSVELADISADLRNEVDGIDEDPERLAEVRSRRQLLRELCRKYGDSLADVIVFGEAAAERLAELERFESRAATLDSERQAAQEAVGRAAAAVGSARRAAAPLLGAAVTEHLQALAMPRAVVEVEVGDDPGDDVHFLLAANPGEALLPLTRVASGGELARAMLALRLVLSEAPDTLVFDEVDAGIGGAAAVSVAESLARLGERHQVLVVTHLAHVAARADQQVVVSKHLTVIDGTERTRTAAETLTERSRVVEIARMLSGDPSSAAALQHAEELLVPNAAKARRR